MKLVCVFLIGLAAVVGESSKGTQPSPRLPLDSSFCLIVAGPPAKGVNEPPCLWIPIEFWCAGEKDIIAITDAAIETIIHKVLFVYRIALLMVSFNQTLDRRSEGHKHLKSQLSGLRKRSVPVIHSDTLTRNSRSFPMLDCALPGSKNS